MYLSVGPPETVLNDIEEFMPSETESLGEEPPRPQEPETQDDQDAVSRNSLDDEVCIFAQLTGLLMSNTKINRLFKFSYW